MAFARPHPLNSPTSTADDHNTLPASLPHGTTWPLESRYSLKNLARRSRKSTRTSLQTWTAKNDNLPYSLYVHQLVSAGWSNLRYLEDFLSRPIEPKDELVSVLDISGDFKHQHPNLETNLDLVNFLATNPKPDNTVRLYMAEYDGVPSPQLIETFGRTLELDPRFFGWSIHGQGHIFTPSQRHRAPYISLGCGILDAKTSRATDVERFKVLVYIKPDKPETETGWTGLFLFSSRTKIRTSIQLLQEPPAFSSPIPPTISAFKSFRELYLESFDFINLSDAAKSPFYLVSNLFRLNCFCWNQIVTTIREEDARVGGISDTTIGHAEEVTKTFSIVKRGGSYGWHGKDEEAAKRSQADLEEDFNHLQDQIDLLWETRNKMREIRKRNSDSRWTALTNAFTYLFAPVTIISGIYGMNVSQISGDPSNPNIWQFFVAVAVFNLVVVAALSFSAYIQITSGHGRKAHWWEVLGYSVGKVGCK